MPIHGYPGNIITANPTEPSQTSASGVWTTELQLQYQNAGKWPPPYYLISRSLRFNSADSANLSRTPASAGNRKTWTYSVWLKRSRLSSNPGDIILLANAASTDAGYFEVRFGSTDQLFLYGWNATWRQTTQVFRDASAWYHIVIAVDTTQATANNRIRLYVNGSEVTAFATTQNPAQNDDLGINSAAIHRISGNSFPDAMLFGGYMTEINFIGGSALTPSSFGQTNASTGVWEPIKYTGSYSGTNSFYLNFSDNSNTTSTTLGKDSSGNGNNWTPNNFSVTAGAGNDSLVDTPTSYGSDTGAGGEVRGNYCTWNGVSIGTDATLANGNLDISYGSGITRNSTMGTFGMSSGKWYWEVTITASSASPTNAGIGISNNPSSSSVANYPGFTSTSWGYVGDGNKYNNSSPSAYGATYTTNDVISFAFDVDAGSITAYKNGVSQGVMFSGLAANTYYPAIGDGGGTSTFTAAANFGQRPFAYTAPSGFKALCTQNLPTPTIGATSTTQAGKYFNPVLYTGTGSNLAVTGVGFQPDLLWIKQRAGTESHTVFDAVRGVDIGLTTNTTAAEVDFGVAAQLSFDSDGFTLGTNGRVNTNTSTFVAWNWKANGAGSSNTAGTITSTVSANTTSGFSIVTYTGTGANATVGHGLGVAPQMIIIKNRQAANSWVVYHVSIGNGNVLLLNSTNASTADSTAWNTTTPTSTVFSLGSGAAADTNQTSGGGQHVAYCFAAVAGYSAFGSYTGNGSSDGPFVYLGFRPRFVMIKRSDSNANLPSWMIWDTARSTFNATVPLLYPNTADAESNAANWADILSNGFKLRNTDSWNNASGGTYIYAAFAESPFKYALAR